MKGTRAAQRYAKAILELANDKKVAKDVKEDMLSISKTIENSEDLRSTLASPVIKPSLKNQILKAIFKDVNGLTTGVFNLLVENNRINILDVVSTVNIVLGLAPWIDSADYNADGVINVLDIVSIVNVIMN